MSALKKSQIEWTVLLTAIVALFWSIQHLVAGEVPEVKEVRVADLTIVLPFGISRWWDILIVPIWSATFIWFGNQCDRQAAMFHIYVVDYLLDNQQWKAVFMWTLFSSMLATILGIGISFGGIGVGLATLLMAAWFLIMELVCFVSTWFDLYGGDQWFADLLCRFAGVLLGSILGFSLAATLAVGVIGGLVFATAIVVTYHILYFKRSWIYLPPVNAS